MDSLGSVKRTWLTVLLIAAVMAGCSSAWHPRPGERAFGPVRNAADAEAAARMLTSAPDDWTVVSVAEGRGASVPLSSRFAGDDPAGAAEQQARLDRDDWHVHLQGPQADVGCRPQPCMGTGEALIDVDAEFGVALFGYAMTHSDDLNPGPTPDLPAGGAAGGCHPGQQDTC